MSPRYEIFGDHGVLISWEAKISQEIHLQVMRMDRFISEMYKEVILECVPTYQSLAVYLHRNFDPKEVIPKFEKNFPSYNAKSIKRLKNIITVPVCYKKEFSTDLDLVATHTKLTTGEVVRKHIKPTYRVYFIGFLPGFPYLGGLDEALITPRLDSPRQKVNRGSVGIGGSQTGIYTLDSPGGWNIIGRSPIQFFSTEESPPSLMRAGDYVRFISISKREFSLIEKAVFKGEYIIEREQTYD